MDNIIKQHKAKGTQYYGLLGQLLAKLKVLYYKKWYICQKDNAEDTYTILNCKHCVKNSSVSSYFSKLGSFVDYGKRYVNFLITVGKQCQLYWKFKRTAVPIGVIKTHKATSLIAWTKSKIFGNSGEFGLYCLNFIILAITRISFIAIIDVIKLNATLSTCVLRLLK